MLQSVVSRQARPPHSRPTLSAIRIHLRPATSWPSDGQQTDDIVRRGRGPPPTHQTVLPTAPIRDDRARLTHPATRTPRPSTNPLAPSLVGWAELAKPTSASSGGLRK